MYQYPIPYGVQVHTILQRTFYTVNVLNETNNLKKEKQLSARGNLLTGSTKSIRFEDYNPIRLCISLRRDLTLVCVINVSLEGQK